MRRRPTARDGRAPRGLVDQRHLAEAPGRGRGGRPRAVHGDADVAGLDDDERLAGLALLGDRLARTVRPLEELSGETLQERSLAPAKSGTPRIRSRLGVGTGAFYAAPRSDLSGRRGARRAGARSPSRPRRCSARARSRLPRKSSRSSACSTTSVRAVTVAVRGTSRSRAISPNDEPGPRTLPSISTSPVLDDVEAVAGLAFCDHGRAGRRAAPRRARRRGARAPRRVAARGSPRRAEASTSGGSRRRRAVASSGPAARSSVRAARADHDERGARAERVDRAAALATAPTPSEPSRTPCDERRARGRAPRSGRCAAAA